LQIPPVTHIVPVKELCPIITGDSTAHNGPVTWHAAFRDGIQLTFLPYRHVLSFEFEYPLNTEPLRIDAVIIKKQPDAVIGNPLGAIFRKVNIVEYKSPGDYLSTGDYHKVGAYARLYSVLNRIPTTEMTISFAAEVYPRNLLKYLKNTYGYKVEEENPGIYRVKGDIFAAQVIETKKLKEEDGGIWLRDLRNGLKGKELREIIERGKELPKGSPLTAYLAMVLQANGTGLEEVVEMPNVTLEEVLEKHGFIERWEARGREIGLEKGREIGLEKGQEIGLEKGREIGLEKGREEAVKRLRKHGMDPAEIAEALELPPAAVTRYLNAK
jgi:hypothetical protein